MADQLDITRQEYKLNMIYFYLTADCNLRCRHCWIAPRYHSSDKSSSFLPFELYCKILTEAKTMGLTGVKLTGGEPLFHPNIGDILDYTHKENININIETNGVLCTPYIAEKIASNKVSFISVSLDSADAKMHDWIRGVDGCFEKTIAGIKNLINVGIKPQVIMTVMRYNKDQITSMVNLCESLGLNSLKLNIVQPTARGEKMKNAGDTLSINELIDLGQWVERDLSKTSKLKIFYGHPLAFRPLSNMFGEKGNGCGICGIKNIIGVLADGSYALCGIGESIPELIFGNASHDVLSEIWGDNSIINELHQHLPKHLEGICSRCSMKQICLGSCIAQNYYRSKNLWSPYWYCEEAYAKGLFPSSRLIYNK